MPGAGVGSLPDYLCDKMGIIYVGLAYRCKAQGGTFELAMEDLKASIEWFEARAPEYNADLSRVGFSGGSAGTPLSSMLAQQTPEAKVYVGFFGVYDLLNNSESLFPNEEARSIYGLATEAQQRESSAFHHLRSNPPATLLFHGGNDILTHPTQSIRFDEQIRAHGGQSEVVIFAERNHGYFSPRNPDEYKATVLAVAEHFNEHFELNFQGMAGLKEELNQNLDRFYPIDLIDLSQLVGTWKAKKETIVLNADGTGSLSTARDKALALHYTIEGSKVMVAQEDGTETFYMTRDQRTIYRIYAEGRFAGRKENYTKQR
jgi:dienelactone hydrolase